MRSLRSAHCCCVVFFSCRRCSSSFSRSPPILSRHKARAVSSLFCSPPAAGGPDAMCMCARARALYLLNHPTTRRDLAVRLRLAPCSRTRRPPRARARRFLRRRAARRGGGMRKGGEGGGRVLGGSGGGEIKEGGASPGGTARERGRWREVRERAARVECVCVCVCIVDPPQRARARARSRRATPQKRGGRWGKKKRARGERARPRVRGTAPRERASRGGGGWEKRRVGGRERALFFAAAASTTRAPPNPLSVSGNGNGKKRTHPPQRPPRSQELYGRRPLGG